MKQQEGEDRLRMQARHVECAMCFKPCDKRLEELAWMRCSRCGNIVCHWSCVVKRTTLKQRKWLEAFMPYNDAPPVPCPNIHLESGELCSKAIVGCIREGAKSSVRKYADYKARQQEEHGMDSNMSSRVLVCRGLEEGVDATALSALFSAYGEVEDCKVAGEKSDVCLVLIISF